MKLLTQAPSSGTRIYSCRPVGTLNLWNDDVVRWRCRLANHGLAPMVSNGTTCVIRGIRIAFSFNADHWLAFMFVQTLPDGSRSMALTLAFAVSFGLRIKRLRQRIWARG